MTTIPACDKKIRAVRKTLLTLFDACITVITIPSLTCQEICLLFFDSYNKLLNMTS